MNESSFDFTASLRGQKIETIIKADASGLDEVSGWVRSRTEKEA